jgi:hypothetical protein
MREAPNKITALDAAVTVLLQIERFSGGASEFNRSAI